MTTTDTSFVAQGPAAIGFSAKASRPTNPFKFGALAVGHETGVYGAIDDIAIPPPKGSGTKPASWAHPTTSTASSAFHGRSVE